MKQAVQYQILIILIQFKLSKDLRNEIINSSICRSCKIIHNHLCYGNIKLSNNFSKIKNPEILCYLCHLANLVKISAVNKFYIHHHNLPSLQFIVFLMVLYCFPTQKLKKSLCLWIWTYDHRRKSKFIINNTIQLNLLNYFSLNLRNI